MLVLAAALAAALRPTARLLAQVIWLRFCRRLLAEPDGLERLRQAAPHALAGLDAVHGRAPDATPRPEGTAGGTGGQGGSEMSL